MFQVAAFSISLKYNRQHDCKSYNELGFAVD